MRGRTYKSINVKTKTSGYLFIGLTVFLFSSFTQTDEITLNKVKSELFNINKAYADKPEQKISLVYKLYDNYTTQNASSISKGYFIRSGKKYCSEILGIVTLQTDLYLITVDTVNKLVLINNPNNKIPEISPQLISGTLEYCTSIKYNPNIAGSAQIRLFLNEKISSYSSITVDYNSKSYLLKKITIYHFRQETDDKGKVVQQKPRTEINYSYDSEGIHASALSEKKYIKVISPKKLALTTAFSKYKLIDQRP